MSDEVGPRVQRGAPEAGADVVEVAIAAPPERIWRALREPAELRRWHGWDADNLDEEVEQIYGAEAKEDGRTLILRGTEIEVGADGTVRFRMTAGRDDPVWGEWYDEIVAGWTTFAQQLRFALERHPGQDRVAHYLQGPQPRPEVGPSGSRYAVGGLTGEVWFRSADQLGLTVDQWGDGLLVLQPAAAVLTGYGVTPTGWPA